MGKIADGDMMAARGGLALRRRYVRRADYLANDTEFRRYTERFRAAWRREFPQYRLGDTGHAIQSEFPPNLLEDWRENHRLFDSRPGLTGDLSKEEISAHFRQVTAPLRAPERLAMDFWSGQVDNACRRYFPAEDFPTPWPNGRDDPDSEWLSGNSPASRFIGASLQIDPRLIGDADALVPRMTLEPVPLYPYLPGPSEYIDEAAGESEDDPAPESPPEPESGADMQWFVPLYPGITSTDIVRAAAAIADAVNTHYGPRTPGARVHALRAEGLTYQQIANRLGLTAQNVARILAANGGGAHGH